ncbi:MAG: hypothetical protein ACK5NN_09420 [Sphingomonadaceae bacterium]
MSVVVDTHMASRLAFHRIRARTGRYLHEQIPSRFSLMSREDTDIFVEIAFSLCQGAELVSEEELRYVCSVMTLFGHRFYEDPRYVSVSSILLDTDKQARQRRTRPIVEALVLKLWGQKQDRQAAMSRLCVELRKMEVSDGSYDIDWDAKLLAPGCLRPDADLRQLFVENAKDIMMRLRLEGEGAERICFWTAWILGLDFDRNPQFSWLVRSIDAAGDLPMRRQKKLVVWLLKLAREDGFERSGVE